MSDFDHILIAIHGIGSQQRNATVRSVANRIAASQSLRITDGAPPLAPQPLGYFFSDVKGVVKVLPLDEFAKGRAEQLTRIGFTEVFWADIPQDAVKEGRTVEETKAWARTLMARAGCLFKERFYGMKPDDPERLRLVEPDFNLGAEVLDEIIDTVYVLENLCYLGEKAGLFKFELDDMLEEYVGDVQIVTEFRQFRRDIIGRFHLAMKQVHETYPDAQIHIVAHSEGTVVSFLGLLHAFSGEQFPIELPAEPEAPANPDKPAKKSPAVPEWLKSVRGFMTIGSPIDKHILLWPRLFRDFDFTPVEALFKDRKIEWRNYYDYGDPVGFKLDTARRWLAGKAIKPFAFCGCNDIGFARYVLPGKAHNDYWDDAAVFEHYVCDVIRGEGEKAPRPQTRPLVYLVSPLIPYAISFAVLAAGTFLFYRAVSAYLNPELDPLQRYIRVSQLGFEKTAASISGLQMLIHSAAIAALIAGATAVARIPRLAAGIFWYFVGLLVLGAGCFSYWKFVQPASRQEIGLVFQSWGAHAPTLGVWALALLVGLIGLLVKIPSHESTRPDRPRRQRWILQGMRPMILCGALGIILLIGAQMHPEMFGKSAFSPAQVELIEKDKLDAEAVQTLKDAHLKPTDIDYLLDPKTENREAKLKLAGQIVAHPPVWPVLLNGAIFLYLWWLGALIFDLAFVWQRYVRHAFANRRLMQWSGYATTTEDKPNPQSTARPIARSDTGTTSSAQ